MSDLQQQPLLWVETLGFGRKVPEELGIELVHAIDEASLGVANAARLPRIGVVKPSMFPTVLRHVADGINASEQRVPIGDRRIDATG